MRHVRHEWVTAYRPNIAKKFYCEETNKKMMACYGNDWYQQYQKVEGGRGTHNLNQSSEVCRYWEANSVKVRVEYEEKEPST